MRRTAFRRLVTGIVFSLLLIPSPLLAQNGKSKRSECLTLFGNRHLQDAAVVAEVEVGTIRNAGMGIEVATLIPVKIMLDHLDPGTRRTRGLLVFVNSGDLEEGTQLTVFLSLFGSGRWYRIRHRLLQLDEDYNEKKRLILSYIGVEKNKDRPGALADLKKLLLDGIGDDSAWIRWNTIRELDSLVRRRGEIFGDEDCKKIDAIGLNRFGAAYGKELVRIKSAIGKIVEDRSRDRKKSAKERRS